MKVLLYFMILRSCFISTHLLTTKTQYLCHHSIMPLYILPLCSINSVHGFIYSVINIMISMFCNSFIVFLDHNFTSCHISYLMCIYPYTMVSSTQLQRLCSQHKLDLPQLSDHKPTLSLLLKANLLQTKEGARDVEVTIGCASLESPRSNWVLYVLFIQQPQTPWLKLKQPKGLSVNWNSRESKTKGRRTESASSQLRRWSLWLSREKTKRTRLKFFGWHLWPYILLHMCVHVCTGSTDECSRMFWYLVAWGSGMHQA